MEKDGKLAWLLNFVVSLCTIVPVAYGGYQYVTGANRPHLTYAVHPVRSVVADPAVSSRLRLLLDDKPLNVPVYLVRVLIWNAGSSPIVEATGARGDGLAIVSRPRRTLIDASLDSSPQKFSRASVFTIDRRQLAAGRVPIHWQRLEAKEHAVVQLVYDKSAGRPEFVIEGSLNDEPEIAREDIDLAARVEVLKARTLELLLMVVIDFLLLVGVLIGLLRSRRGVLWVLCASGFFVITLVIGLWIGSIAVGPRLPVEF